MMIYVLLSARDFPLLCELIRPRQRPASGQVPVIVMGLVRFFFSFVTTQELSLA